MTEANILPLLLPFFLLTPDAWRQRQRQRQRERERERGRKEGRKRGGKEGEGEGVRPPLSARGEHRFIDLNLIRGTTAR